MVGMVVVVVAMPVAMVVMLLVVVWGLDRLDRLLLSRAERG